MDRRARTELFSIRELLCILAALGWVSGAIAESAFTQSQIDKGVAAFQKGAFEEAVTHWKDAAGSAEVEQDSIRQIDSLINLGLAYRALGHLGPATNALDKALHLATKNNDRAGQIAAKNGLGMAWRLTAYAEKAELSLREALEMARADGNPSAEALIANNLGNQLVDKADYTGALSQYRESIKLATQTSNQALLAKARANYAFATSQEGKTGEAEEACRQATDQISKLTPSHDQASLFLLVGRAYHQSRNDDGAREAYQRALRVGESLGDTRAVCSALGYMGESYETEKEYNEALKVSRRAVFLAQQIQSADDLFRWHWQTGRVEKALGDREAAIVSYRNAIQSLQPIRNDMALARGGGTDASSFRRSTGAVFYEMADLLLQKAAVPGDADRTQRTLREARDTLEQLKSAELEDYLQDECASIRSRGKQIESIPRDTAVIYIIPLKDRTELLVNHAGAFQRFKADVAEPELTRTVLEFRKHLGKRTTDEFLGEGRQLHQWLITPIKGWLGANRVHTLVFVPDGPLRTIPMAALHDGKQFLIEQYAVAVSPGLSVMLPTPSQRGKVTVSLNGVSRRVQDFSALRYVPIELEGVEALYQGNSKKLLDEAFNTLQFEREVQEEQYSVVHIASHGQFSHDMKDTFILTHDGRLRLNDLERVIRPSQYRGKPIELLTLSACQTAAGDDRAVLGLAGAAVKAGARSALATLWFVNDAATAEFIEKFYSQLTTKESLTKAKALQKAQIQMIQQGRYEHPCYWAPYLLIGNWL